MVVLYEPVWALGTGRAAGIRTGYAGSVRPENAAAYAALPHVDGVAVGTASLYAQKLAAIIHAVDRAD